MLIVNTLTCQLRTVAMREFQDIDDSDHLKSELVMWRGEAGSAFRNLLRMLGAKTSQWNFKGFTHILMAFQLRRKTYVNFKLKLQMFT